MKSKRSKSRNSDSSVDQVQIGILKSKLVDSWSVQEVAIWLDYIGLGSYKKVFIENEISGSELVDLSEAEMTSIGITKLGHRKRLVLKIQEISDTGGDWETSSSAGSDSSSATSACSSSIFLPSRRSSAASNISFEDGPKNEKVVIKLRYKKKIRVISVDQDVRMDTLKRMVKKEFHQRMRLFYRDADNDVYQIKRTSHLKAAITQFLRSGASSMNVICKSKKHLNDEAYNSKLDGVVTTDEDGVMLEVNSAFCHLWGYKKEELIGNSCNMLMPKEMANKHNDFMKRYIDSGVPHILGKGRPVVGQKKDGSLFTLYLILTEKQVHGNRQFCATFSPVKKEESTKTNHVSDDTFVMLENLLDPCIVINEAGIMVFSNKATEDRLGHPARSLRGKNVKTIIPPGKYRDEHDAYLANYMKTGKGKIIGIGRVEKVLHEDGREMPVKLSISERKVDSKHSLFTGVLRLLEDSEKEDSEEMEAKELEKESQVVGRLVVPGVIINSSGTIMYANAAAGKLYGYKEDYLIGKNCKILMPDPEGSMHDNYLINYCKSTKKGQSRVVGMGREVISKHRNGRLLPVHISVSEFTVNNKYFFTAILQKK